MPLFASHIHFIKRIIARNKLFKKNLSSYRLAIIGSILPDLDMIKGLNLDVHGRCRDFYFYLKRVDPKFAPLGWGMYVHDLLDKYVENGFVRKKSKYAKEILGRFDHGIEAKEDMMAHLLVEHSIENLLLSKHPGLIREILHARRRFNKRRLAKHLYDFFSCNKKMLTKVLWFLKRVSLRDFRTDRGVIMLWINYSFVLSNENMFRDFHSKFKVLKNTILLRRHYHKYKEKQLKKMQQTEVMFSETKKKIEDIHKELDKAVAHIEKKLFG